MPPLIKVFFAVVALSFVVALIRLPGVVSTAVDFERGKAAGNSGQIAKAVRLFRRVHADYPAFVDATLDLIVADVSTGTTEGLREGATLMDSLNGQKVTAEQEEKYNALNEAFEAIAKKIDEEATKGKAKAGVKQK